MAVLGDTPQGHELEEYFAALLQSTGHYVEKNIEDPHILELDIVATDYSREATRPRLFEVKGTSAKLEDIFKLIGRMRYLGIDEGAFVTTARPRDDRDVEWFKAVCGRTNVTFVMVQDLGQALETFEQQGFGKADQLRHAVWRFSYWIERIYVRTIRQLRPTNRTASAAVDYYNLVNSGVFLTADYLAKVRKIYAAYSEHPGLTSEMADELGGDRSGRELMNEALYRSSHVPLHATMFLEHRARLSLLKAAVDYLRSGGALEFDRPGTVDFRLIGFPRTFVNGLDWLQAQSRYWLFPLFWQNLLWAWGGILPTEHRETVLGDIARSSGLTPREAETALQAFDKLFPIEKGWVRSATTASYEYVLLTPAHFQGLGVFHQRLRAGVEKYTEYVTTGQYTATDFAQWNNAAAKLMEDEAASRR